MLEPLRRALPSDSLLYVEPFCGSAALFFDQRPRRAVLSDINFDLINFYKCSRKQPNEVFAISSRLRRTKATYLRVRKEIAETEDSLVRAAYFYYLNRNCFNGLYRTNKQGVFNVPFSQSRTGRMLSKEEFMEAASVLKSAKFRVTDFESCISTHLQRDAFFFLEPKSNLVPIKHSSAAHPSIAGQVAAPDLQRVALLGLGYEYGVSLNILESHEPDISFVFRPNGVDDRFKDAVRDANFGFDFGERNYEIVDYFLHDMAGAYDDISSLIFATKHNSSIIAVPLGPKILSATMILAGRMHQPQVSVLRYSVAPIGAYQDIAAEGILVGVAVTLMKDRDNKSALK